MLPYFVMVGVPAFLAVLFQCIKLDQKKANRIVIDAFFLIWLILLFLRSNNVGVDLVVYEWHFAQYPILSWSDIFNGFFTNEFEFGFVAICKVLSYFTDNFQWVITICAMIAIVPIWKMYRDEGTHGFLMIAVFLGCAPFVMYFSGLRQTMAMAFIPLCYRFCKEKKVWHFLGMVLVAYLFHRSALIMLLAYPIYHLRLKQQWHLVYLIPFIALFYLFNEQIFTVLAMILGNFRNETIAIRSTGAYAVTLLLVIILLYTFLIPDQNKLDDDTIGLRNILILSAILQTFSAVNTVAMRLNYYFLLLIPILISKVIRSGNEKYNLLIRLSVVCMTVFFTFYYFYNAYTGSDALHVYPYEFFFQQTPTMY